jgi:hypothetical protein
MGDSFSAVEITNGESCQGKTDIDNSTLNEYIHLIIILREWRNWQTHWT